ncbi:helix-turn-helix domain-containing protein [Streptomyces sp. NPDC056309]|uniref:helix-turn-helix domain-containing protein n=1 Tax=Streptomyces sp. NPDC056309 TaxID=3345781 RepID=UPI0035E1DE43
MARNEALTGEDRRIVAAEFAELYRANHSIRAIAERTSRSYGGVRALLVEAGVTFRSRGARRPY